MEIPKGYILDAVQDDRDFGEDTCDFCEDGEAIINENTRMYIKRIATIGQHNITVGILQVGDLEFPISHCPQCGSRFNTETHREIWKDKINDDDRGGENITGIKY